MKFAVLIISALTIIGLASAGLPVIGVPEIEVPEIEVPEIGSVGNADATQCVTDIEANCCFSIPDQIFQKLLGCTTASKWSKADPEKCKLPNANICNDKTSFLYKICYDFSIELHIRLGGC